jgi:hypothetical protein
MIQGHHAFVRVPAAFITKGSTGRTPDVVFPYTDPDTGVVTDYAVFLVDGETVDVLATGTPDTSLTLANHIEMASVCLDDKVDDSLFSSPSKKRNSLLFSWKGAHLASNPKGKEKWQFDPPIEGGTSTSGLVAQEIYFRLALTDVTVRINSTDLEDKGTPLPSVVLDASGGHLRVWIGHTTLNNILMKDPNHTQVLDTDFELYYDLIRRNKHRGLLHVPKRTTVIESMHGSNCPPIIVRPPS